MGGHGSGRKPDPVKSFFKKPIVRGYNDDIYLPNLSGVKKHGNIIFGDAYKVTNVSGSGYVLNDGSGNLSFGHDGGGSGHDPVTVSDSSTIDFTLTGQNITATTIDSAINHNSLLNTHNLTTDINHNTILNNHNLTTDIDHDQLSNFVANEHIDWTSASAGTIHATNYVDNDTTDHTLLSNIGTNTHAQIDTHISTSNIHFTEASIDHGSISGLSDDDHSQYIFNSPTSSTRNVIQPTTASDIPFTIKGASSQSGNLLSLQNSSSTQLTYFDSSGFINIDLQGAGYNINLNNNSITNSGFITAGMRFYGTQTCTNLVSLPQGVLNSSTYNYTTTPFLNVGPRFFQYAATTNLTTNGIRSDTLPYYANATINVDGSGVTATSNLKSFTSLPTFSISNSGTFASGTFSTGFDSGLVISSGTLPSCYLFYARNPTGAGTLTRLEGFRIEELTKGTTNWGIWQSGETGWSTQGYLQFREKTTTPSNPTTSNQVNIYMKDDKLIFQYDDAGTIRYKYLDLTGTGVTWTHTTTAP